MTVGYTLPVNKSFSYYFEFTQKVEKRSEISSDGRGMSNLTTHRKIIRLVCLRKKNTTKNHKVSLCMNSEDAASCTAAYSVSFVDFSDLHVEKT